MPYTPAAGQIWPQGQPRQRQKNRFFKLFQAGQYDLLGYPQPFYTDAVATDEDFDKVTLLLDMEGVAGSSLFVDRSTFANPITTYNGAVISDTRAKFGSGSLSNNNQNRYLEIGGTQNLSFPGDFTIEVWFWAEASQPSYPTVFEIGTYQNGILFRPYHSGGGLWVNNNNLGDFLNETLLPKQQWNHAAFVRSGTAFACYLNGQLDKSATISGTINSSATTSRIGSSTHNADQHLNGYIDEIRVTKGLARYVGPFDPPTEPFPLFAVPPEPEPGTDPDFASVSLLLHMDGSDGGTVFTDSSVNSQSITANGGVQTSTVQSRFGGASAFFNEPDGHLSTQYIQGLYDWWTSDFTVEAWVYATSWTSWSFSTVSEVPCMVGNMSPTGLSNFWSFGPTRNGKLKLYYFNGAVQHGIVTSASLPTAQWNHVAAVKTSAGVRLFINGVDSDGVFSVSGTPLSNDGFDLIIGTYNNQGIRGYIDDLRITKGARYVANFTPPTTPFPDSAPEPETDPNFANVSLLIPMGGTAGTQSFLDASTYGHTVAAIDPTLSSEQTIFGLNVAKFVPSSGNRITVPASTAFEVGSGNYTFEAFLFFNSSASSFIFGTADSRLALLIDDSRWVLKECPTSADRNTFVASSSLAPATGLWLHIALVRSGSTSTLYVDGVSVVSGTTAEVVNTDAGIVLGQGFSRNFSGFFGPCRFTKGVARYTANFTPPAAPFPDSAPEPETDPDFANVSLLLHMDGSNGSTTFTDSSSNALAVTANGNAQISTAQSKFGGASALFDGSSDYLYAPAPAGNLENGDFTVEGWFRFASTSHNGGLFHLRNGIPSSTTSGLALGHDGSNFQIYAANTVYHRTFALSANTWYHVALVRSAGSIMLYVNGVAQGAAISNSTTYDTTNGIGVGIYYSSSFTFNGHVDDFRVSKVARYTANFTPPAAPFPGSIPEPEVEPDPDFANVSLLLHMDGSNGSTTFADDSGNALTVVANGNAQISTAESKFGGASCLLDGNGDYLSVASSSLFDFGSGVSFTVECFINPTTLTRGAIISQRISAVYAPFEIVKYDSSQLQWLIGNASVSNWEDIAISSNVLTVNTWHHIALVGDGTNLKLYCDGTQVLSTSQPSWTSANRPLYIGAGGDNAMTGYIDDLRITKGVARYTANFTPPTAPFPDSAPEPETDPDFANVSLLLHMDGSNGGTTFADNSSNAHSITAFGNAQVSTTDPKYGTGVLLLDGNGDYLQTPADADFAFGTGDFTVECWCYTTVVNDNDGLFTFGGTSSGLFLALYNSGWWLGTTGSGGSYMGPATADLNTWRHVAVTRSGTSLRLFIDGVQQGSTLTNSANLTDNQLKIGYYYGTAYGFVGKIDEFRVTKGVARYTANFTPPTAPFSDSAPEPETDPYFANVSLLLHMDGSDGGTAFTDSSSYGHAITALGAAQISSAGPKFGTGSFIRSGSNSDLITPSSSAFQLGSGDFTVEFWVYLTSSAQDQGFFTFGGTASGLGMGVDGTELWVVTTGGDPERITGGTVPLNEWSFLAVTRSSGNMRAFINGTQVGSTYSSLENFTDSQLKIGYAYLSVYGFVGKIDEFRVTKGVARYTANFTPPTAPFPDA